MKKLVVTCEDGSRWVGGDVDETLMIPRVENGVLTVSYRLASRAVSVEIVEDSSDA